MNRLQTEPETSCPGLEKLAGFPLLSALLGRRSRRFPLGGKIPDGPFAFASKEKPQPLSELETSLIEAHCPPYFKDMRAAVTAVVRRKFGPGGPFHPATPGPWKDSRRIRSAAASHSARFQNLIALMAEYVYDRFGKFPATLPSVYCQMYLQAQHIDLEYYDRFYNEGAYLETHVNHMTDWH
jgi:hypothetical protein